MCVLYCSKRAVRVACCVGVKSEKRIFGFMNQTYHIQYINNRRGEEVESEEIEMHYCILFSLSPLSETSRLCKPFTINTGAKSPIRRSYSVVAHHEALSRLRPGFKSRYEHPFTDSAQTVYCED